MAQSSTFDAVKISHDGNGTRSRQREQFATYRELFERVTRAYVVSRAYPVVCAFDIDPEPLTRSHRWTPDVAHWLCDTERATEAALDGAPDLQRAWFRMASEESVPAHIAQQVINKCGRFYTSRRVDPGLYFKKGGK